MKFTVTTIRGSFRAHNVRMWERARHIQWLDFEKVEAYPPASVLYDIVASNDMLGCKKLSQTPRPGLAHGITDETSLYATVAPPEMCVFEAILLVDQYFVVVIYMSLSGRLVRGRWDGM